MITGFRKYNWAVDRNKTSAPITLEGMNGVRWPKAELTATCEYTGGYRGSFRGTASPERAQRHLMDTDDPCSCGIYLPKTEEYLETSYLAAPVTAALVGWGAFIEYDKGYRLQHARIERLWVNVDRLPYPSMTPGASVEQLQKRYGCIVETRVDPVKESRRVMAKALMSAAAAPGPLQPHGVRTGRKSYLPPQHPLLVMCQKCSRMHDITAWHAQDGRQPMVCEMATDHIVNAKKWVEARPTFPWQQKWIQIFEAELKERAPKLVNGRMTVTF